MPEKIKYNTSPARPIDGPSTMHHQLCTADARARRQALIKVYPITYSKAQLDAVPEVERIFYLMAGQLTNDLNWLSNLLMFSINPVDGPPVRAHVNRSLTMFLMRLLAGRLHEGWRMTRGKPFREIYRKYESELAIDTKQNLRVLKTYFGRADCTVEKIRNKMGFHSDVELFKEGYRAFTSDEIFTDYLAEARGHCYYGAADMVNVFAMTKILPKVDWQAAYRQIADDIMRVSQQLTDVVLDLMKVFTARYIGASLTPTDLERNKVVIENAPFADEVNIPFFSKPPRNYG